MLDCKECLSVPVCMHACLHVSSCVYLNTGCTYIYLHVSTYVQIYVFMYVCMYIEIFCADMVRCLGAPGNAGSDKAG